MSLELGASQLVSLATMHSAPTSACHSLESLEGGYEVFEADVAVAVFIEVGDQLLHLLPGEVVATFSESLQ